MSSISQINKTSDGQVEVSLTGKVDEKNTTKELLLAGISFVGDAVNVLNTALVVVNVFSDVDSAENGFVIQSSSNGLDGWLDEDKYTIYANSINNFKFPPGRQFYRVKYTNGLSDQGVFDLQLVLKGTNSVSSSHRIDDDISPQDDAVLQKAVIATQRPDGDFSNINDQHPLPIDIDSVFVTDLDLENSDNYNFSGTIEDYFDSLISINCDDTANNPKQIKIVFNRTVYASTIGFGCNDILKSFSNVKIDLLGSAGEVRRTIDESADNTKENSKLVPFPASAFNAIMIEFHTTDEVCISNLTIRKDTRVNIDQVEPTTNSVKVIDYSHAELHSGDHYVVKDYVSVLKAGVKEFIISTPDTKRWAHMVLGVDAVTSSITIDIYEGVSTTSDGTAINNRNRNRNFSDDNTTICYEDPTGLTGDVAGNLLQASYLGAGKNSAGGGIRDSEEMLLKQNTKYLVRVTELNIAATVVNYTFDWYEHTNIE